MEMVTISLARLKELMEDQRLLDHLRANGVDNWEGYSAPHDAEYDDEEEEGSYDDAVPHNSEDD